MPALTPTDGRTADGDERPAIPTLRRRLACMVYEAVLLFGVVMLVGLAYGVATQQRHALAGTTGLQAMLFVALGAYFVHFWSRSGQTLAMLTWQLRLQTVGSGAPPTPARALTRYLLAWCWFLPALATAHWAGWRGGASVAAAVAAGVLAYAATALLHPRRQFWHDALCGTQIVHHARPLRGRQALPPASPAPR